MRVFGGDGYEDPPESRRLRPPERQPEIDYYQPPHSVADISMGLIGVYPYVPESVWHVGLAHYIISVRLLGYFRLKRTISARNFGSASAHRHRGTASGSVSPFAPPFVPLFAASKDESLMTLALCVTTVSSGDALRLEISCAAVFPLLGIFSRPTSSPGFSYSRWVVYGAAMVAVLCRAV